MMVVYELKARKGSSLAPVIMIQGTSSSVGKSLIVTGLCRALTRRGLRVAPFKAQNMALNSYVTLDGGEIGIAQAIQAEACQVEASIDMNPILLKPEGDRRSQVVVGGKVLSRMSAMEYHKIKPELRPFILESLNRLRQTHDVVVIEGAGSPAEINLKEGDLVNMFVARSAQAPVILVGDIDRGGVFAAFVGTLALLTPEEQALVRGFIVNKFRGDVELLRPGLIFLEERTGKSVLGVLPYMSKLRIGDEDSIALDDKPSRLYQGSDRISIAILRYPRIANYDEFNALENEPSLHVAYTVDARDIVNADFLILPGSKSVMSDLQWLRDNGLDQAILERAAQKKPMMGICGGYQMLSREIRDPHHCEADVDCLQGFGFVPFDVVFQKQKVTARVQADLSSFGNLDSAPDCLAVRGYEIHMGELLPIDDSIHRHLCRIRMRGIALSDQAEGFINGDGSIRGTLIHGLFHNRAYRFSLLRWLSAFASRSSPFLSQPFNQEEDAYDKLADSIEDHLDMASIYELLNEQDFKLASPLPGSPLTGNPNDGFPVPHQGGLN